MKVNYLQRSHRRFPHGKKILVLTGILVLTLIFFYLFGSSVVGLVSPLWKAENSLLAKAGESFGFFRSKTALVEENNTLKDKVNSLEVELASLRSELIAGGVLKTPPEFREDSGILATVLTRPPQTPYDILIIDAGLNKSISEGAEVFLPEGSLIGTVSEVFAKSSRVKLFSAVDEETSAVLERHNVPVTLVGAGAGNFKIIVPRDTEIVEGDKILSSNTDARLIAVVGEVESSPTESFKEVLAYSPTNIFSLRFVYLKP